MLKATKYRILKDSFGYYWDCNLFPFLPYPRYSPSNRWGIKNRYETFEECETYLNEYIEFEAKPIIIKTGITKLDNQHNDGVE